VLLNIQGMSWRALIDSMLLMIVANLMPWALGRTCGSWWAAPLDFGVTLRDGRRLLGSHKTWRGLGAAIVGCAITAGMLRLHWWLGVEFACCQCWETRSRAPGNGAEGVSLARTIRARSTSRSPAAAGCIAGPARAGVEADRPGNRGIRDPEPRQPARTDHPRRRPVRPTGARRQHHAAALLPAFISTASANRLKVIGTRSFSRGSSRERLLQRREPRLKVPPVRQPASIDGLAYLLRAGCADGAGGAMELQASRFRWQPAVRQQSLYLGLEILNEVLVADMQQPIRQYLVPVILNRT